MSKIGNKELARVLADKHGLDRQAAEQFVAQLFDVLNEGLQYDKQVKVKGLGTFKVTSVASRKSVDVNTGEPIVIEGRDKISFTADAAMRDQVNRPFAQFETVVVNDGVDFDEIDRRFADSMTDADPADVALAERGEAAEPAVETPELPQEAQAAAEPTVTEEAPLAEAAVVQPLRIGSTQLAMLNGDRAARPSAAPGPGHAAQAAEVADRMPETVAAAPQPKEEVLALSPSQLLVLNGQRMPEEPTATPAPVEEPAERVEAMPVETVTATDETVVPEPTVQPLMTSSATPSEGEAQPEEHEAEEAEPMDWREQVAQQQRRLHALMVVAGLLLLVCVGGIFYLSSQLDKRNHRIAHLEAQAKTPVAAAPQPKPAPVAAPADAAKAARQDSLKAVADSVAMAKKRADAEALARQKAEAEQQAAAARKAAEAQRALEAAKLAEQKAKAAQAARYDSDPRVRTGAYVIEGVDRTVTVRSGQTLASISRVNLGPGMECYVEAVNGGRKEFKAGEKVNIPKLKLKKK